MTLPPEQMVVEVEVMETAGMTLVAVMVITLLAAVEGLAHGSLLVSTTDTLSLSARVAEVNVGLLVPAFTPFTFH